MPRCRRRAGLREEVVSALPNAVDVRIDPEMAAPVHPPVHSERGTRTPAQLFADYLDYLGMDATVPTAGGGRADRSTYTRPVVTVYNGAEADMTQTIASLEAALGVKAVLKHDPLVSADMIVITGSATPKLVPPD